MDRTQVRVGQGRALAIADKKWWDGVPLESVARIQMVVTEVIVPFDLFHQGLEKALGTPIPTRMLPSLFDIIWDRLFPDPLLPDTMKKAIVGSGGVEAAVVADRIFHHKG